MKTTTALAWGVLCLSLAGVARAADVTMGIRTDPNSIDPHYHVYTPNSAVARHIFDALTRTNAKGQIVPGLATSWKPEGDGAWIFTLRQGVTFHDGTPFTAADVAFTLERAPHVPNSPSSYSQYTKAITGTEVIDDHTIRILTRAPSPTLPIDLAQVAVISKHA
ncbi:MAG: ABC transporter substrate-binding protein, partial [Rhodospirillales bacterium]|nr:ABC transporter substrate-binding protein [Rhodospirillales bacterium]